MNIIRRASGILSLALAVLLTAGTGLVSSCVLASHADIDSLRHRNGQGDGGSESNGRRTWEGDKAPGFAFGTNGVYYCVYHGDGSHGPHYAYDLELLKGEAGMYRLFWWLDGEQVQRDLTLADGTAVHQGDSVSLKTGELCRLNLPEMAAGDAREHTFTLGVSWKGFEKTLAMKFYQGYPVLSIDDIRQEQNARRTSYRVVSAEDLGEGTLTVYVDGRKAQSVWTGPSLSTSNPLELTLTRDDQPRLLLDQYAKGTHELTVRFDSSDGSRTETAVARWTEPQWQADPDPEPEPEPDPEPEPEPEPDEPLAPYKFVFDCQYDYNRDKYVAQLVLTEGDDADYSISVDFEDTHNNLTSATTVWDYETFEEIDLSMPVHMERNRPLRLVLPDFDPGTYSGQTARPGTYNIYITLAAGGYEVTQSRAYFTKHREMFDVSVDTEAASGLTEFSFELNYRVSTQLHMQFYCDLTDTYVKHDRYSIEANAYGGVLWLESKDETWFSKRGYEYSNGHWLFFHNEVEQGDVFTWKVTKASPGEHVLVLQIWHGWWDSLIGASTESPGYKVTYLYRWTEPDRGN